ncbi:nucleotidyltransferase domain-containing protein [Pedobacter arcticus]|uniref:nucleotidyltransferase domain-containing protein n=1 Tax=Pedobacter arcticus TaxID=752140 RepID=UPI0002F991D3|nr:nucleotidyltransferase domain-containing protein [Pedobacter arcticus]
MENYINIVKGIILKRVPLQKYSVFLFGSRATGNHHNLSDIDVGILGKEPLPIFIKGEIEEEIDESICPLKVDLIDFYQVSDEFKKYALEKIEIWNLSKNSSLNC